MLVRGMRDAHSSPIRAALEDIATESDSTREKAEELDDRVEERGSAVGAAVELATVLLGELSERSTSVQGPNASMYALAASDIARGIPLAMAVVAWCGVEL